MEIKFYNKATLEDVPNQGDYLVGRRGEVYTKLANGTLSKCAMCDWIPAYHFATRIKELEKQVDQYRMAAEEEAKFADEYKQHTNELKESLNWIICRLEDMQLFKFADKEDMFQIQLARKREE